MKENIKLLGHLGQEEIKEYIRKCSFVVVPSIWYENCPYSILETLAIGKPVIGANIGGIPELVKNNENGLIFKYDDVSDLENKMNILFNDSDLVQKLGDNAKKSAKELYSKDGYYKKIIKIYENSIKQRRI